MRLLWVTQVTFGKTVHQWGELGTATALKRKGWEIDFLSHENKEDALGTLENFGFGHIPVKSINLPGVFNISFNRNVSNALCNDLNLEDYSAILSEWQASLGVLKAKRHLESIGYPFPPWLFEDRSPPAHRSILGLIQWIQYRNSWTKAANYADGIEVLVPGLEKFIRQKYHISKPMVHCPSGVDLYKFSIREDCAIRSPIKIVYHGSLTRGRGLKRIIELGKKMENSNLDFQITVFGIGPMASFFHSQSRRNDWLDFLGELQFDQVPDELRKHDIGLLPLPKSLPWDVGSPLKAMEYAASGLCILATDVDGSIPFEKYDWYFVAPSRDPIDSWLESVRGILLNGSNLKVQARKDAETNLSWDSATIDLHNELIRIMNN